MKSCELVSFVTAVACNMASCYSEDELTILSAVFSQLGDTLATILTNESLLESAKASKESGPSKDSDKNPKNEEKDTQATSADESKEEVKKETQDNQ